jgi:hypothetical protein
MWVGEISGTLSIVKMADRRGSPSTPAPLQYLSQKTPVKAYEVRGEPFDSAAHAATLRANGK